MKHTKKTPLQRLHAGCIHLAVLAACSLAHAQPAPPGAAQVAEGRRAYMVAGCYQCHGTEAQGSLGPRLAPKPMTVEALTAFLRNSPRSMPAYPPQVLADGDIQRIQTFLLSVAASPSPDQIPLLK